MEAIEGESKERARRKPQQKVQRGRRPAVVV
jgi:hypothetical protein